MHASLNITLETLKTQIPKKPEIITTYEWTWENIASAEWFDIPK